MRNYFTFNGINSMDYGVYISGSDVFNAPSRDVESIEIPGRNGTLTIDKGRYNNVQIVYPAFIYEDFDSNVSAFRNLLLASSGYKRLEDSYHPDEYRIARYDGSFEVDSIDNRKAGQFKIAFDCYPQRFLKAGETPVEFTSNSSITNRTDQIALPLLRCYGDGTLTIGSVSLTISGSSTYTDIDCELQECYKDTLATNKNSTVTLTNGVFPSLKPGANTITISGITKVIMQPRWWIL